MILSKNDTGKNGTGKNGTGKNDTGKNGTGKNGTGKNGTGINGTGNNGTNGKVGKKGTLMLNFFKPQTQTPHLKPKPLTPFSNLTSNSHSQT